LFRIISISLLIFIGISAGFGGFILILDPTGLTMRLSTDLLRFSPFKNFFYPGIILLTINGFGSLYSAMFALIKFKYYSYFIIASGSALTIWIVTELLMIQTFSFLQILFGLFGVILIISGIFEANKNKSEYQE
jgi:hypothetical protein